MKELYTVKDHPGAHVFIEMRETEAGTMAEMRLIGAILPYSARPEDITIFDPAEDAINSQDKIVMLAQKAAVTFSLDPARINRAADLARCAAIYPKGGYLQILASNNRDRYTVSLVACRLQSACRRGLPAAT